MKSFDLTIYGHRGETFTVAAYEPYAGANFVAHRAFGGREWVTTHRGSTHIAARPENNTRKAALEIAKKLSDACPSASEVTIGADKDGRPSAGNLVGPMEQLRTEILAVVPNPRKAA